VLGVEHAWGRNAASVPGADGEQPRPWTLPVSYHEIRGLVTAVRTACLILTAAASGMRTSELLELRVGCRRPPRTVTGGGQRFRLASKVIKGRQFGGEDDEWVVVAEAKPSVLDTDRRIENLLRAQAASLHVGPANYCWFRDPSKALCLRLAGTMQATRPLIGLCDSARCPQATHHACHRPIWAEQAATFQAFLGNPRVPAGEKPRLRREHDRVQRVLDAIDHTTTPEDTSCR
jgi:hypothetical protein